VSYKSAFIDFDLFYTDNRLLVRIANKRDVIDWIAVDPQRGPQLPVIEVQATRFASPARAYDSDTSAALSVTGKCGPIETICWPGQPRWVKSSAARAKLGVPICGEAPHKSAITSAVVE
jgi:hypothetical protein